MVHPRTPSPHERKGYRKCRKVVELKLEKKDGNSIPHFNEPNDFEWIQKIEECPVYYPSKEEFEDHLLYLLKISPEASKYGICKVVSPLICSTPAGIVLTKEKKDFNFTTNIQPLCIAKPNHDDKISFFTIGRKYTLRDFENMANKASANRFCITGCPSSKFLEREFWKEMMNKSKRSVEYGVNVQGTAFSSSLDDPLARSNWNLKSLPKLPRCTLRLLEYAIPGITEPMLYIGMLFSMFAWHVEDHYLYSINYHHCGAPKTWYGVPGGASYALEKVVEKYVYNQENMKNGENRAFEFIAQKTTMFPPNSLLQNDVPVYRAVQMPGEFVITFPRAYHAGFSHGFNCGEAVNFATSDWFPFGAEACLRYSLMSKMPIIPYEELLCKEAMILSKSSFSMQSVKILFACLLRKHHLARWCLSKSIESLNLSQKFEGTIVCLICKRDCYVAYITCKCYTDPICVFHGAEACCCSLKSNRNLFVRENILEMESVAEKFEQDEAILDFVERQVKCDADSWMQNVHPRVKQEYIPYCQILPVRNENSYGNKQRASMRQMNTSTFEVASGR